LAAVRPVHYAQKAVEIEPNKSESRILLAELLTKAGMKAMAKRQYQELLRIDPNNEVAKKQLNG
jgi:Flp pilus assembly protein TadD